DYWTNQPTGSYELRVTSVDGQSILALATEKDGNAREARYTAEWNAIVSALDRAKLTPDAGLLRFPLRVGATYATRFHQESTTVPGTSDINTGVTIGADFDYSAKVLGLEEVVVPAGR